MKQKQLIVIALVAGVSLFGSYWLYWNSRDAGVWSTTNAGAFVQPRIVVADTGWRDRDDRLPAADVWWLFVVAQPCRDECQAALQQLRQIHILLNKDANRVKRGLVLDETAAVAAEWTHEDEHVRVFSGTDVNTPKDSAVYIVDPIGNLVFRYRLDQAGDPLLKDLKRLLKLSQIG